MRYFRILAWVGVVAGLLALVVGCGGALHPAFDSIGIGRLGAATAVAVCAPVALGARGWLMAAGVVVAMLPLIMARVVPGEAGSIGVYSKNLHFRNPDTAPITADIRTQNPDVVVLQEVSTRNDVILSALSVAYPHQFMCRSAGWNGIAILSKTPFVAASQACSPVRALARVQIDAVDGPFWVVGVHLDWPWPKGQMGDVKRALPVISGLDGHVIVAGDFNNVPWSHAAQLIGQATHTLPLSPRRATYWLNVIPLPLDQVWAPCGGRMERRPQFTSDHYGVMARVNAATC